MEKYTDLMTRVLFVAAFAFAALAVLERIANALGGTIGLRALYEPGRILEFCGIILLFVIALVLRDIKHLLSSRAKAPGALAA